MSPCIVLLRMSIVNRRNLNIALTTSTKNTVVLLPQSILLATITVGVVDHEVASTLAEVWTVLTTGLEETDGALSPGISRDEFTKSEDVM